MLRLKITKRCVQLKRTHSKTQTANINIGVCIQYFVFSVLDRTEHFKHTYLCLKQDNIENNFLFAYFY